MAELNNRKRKLSSENTNLECQEDVGKKQNTNGNGPVNNVEVKPDSDTTATKTGDTFIPKSAIKSFSRFLPRNVVGTIGRKTAILTRRTLRTRTGLGSLQHLNQGWDTISTLSSLGDEGNTQGETTQKRKQTLHKNYTLKLRKLKEKFKTKRQLRKDRFRSQKNVSQDRFRKDLNQSKNSFEDEPDAVMPEKPITSASATPEPAFVDMSEESSSSSELSTSSSESNDYFQMKIFEEMKRTNAEIKKQLAEVIGSSERQQAADEKFLGILTRINNAQIEKQMVEMLTLNEQHRANDKKFCEILTRFVDNNIKFRNSLLSLLKK